MDRKHGQTASGITHLLDSSHEYDQCPFSVPHSDSLRKRPRWSALGAVLPKCLDDSRHGGNMATQKLFNSNMMRLSYVSRGKVA